MGKKARKPRGIRKGRKSGDVWSLTVFLLKPSIKTFKDALHEKSKAVPVHTVDGLGALALKKATAKIPKWAARLAGLVLDAGTLRQQSPGAVLFVVAAGRLFALTFGYGRSLLAPEAIVHDFGIRSVLNTVDAALIRSMDSRTLDASPQMSRKQFVEDRPLAAFALDRMHDLLKGVTGRVKSGVIQFESDLVTGTDSLQCSVRLDSTNELVAKCSDLLDLYKLTDYRANFEFIDHVRFIRDPLLLKTLDALLLPKARSKTSVKDFGFAPPRLLAGEELSRLRCSWKRADGIGEIKPEVVRDRLSDLATRTSSADEFVERLKRDRIELCDQSGEVVIEQWSLYRCLLLEVTSAKAHILTTGDWYEVSQNFVQEVTKRFDKLVSDSIADCPVPLPKQKASQTREEFYNEDTAKALKLELFDKGTMTQGTGASAVEPCDLLDPAKGVFIHVKIGRRSSDLSHLYSQGLVATLTFLDEERARENLRKRPGVKRAKVLQEPVQASKLTTVFAVIDKAPKKGKPWRLPFFSMLVAAHVADRIAQRGVRVHTVRVDAA